MNTRKYKKPALSIDQQIELLKQRGLKVPDLDFTKQCLQSVSYYRFSAYCKPFQNKNHIFYSTVSFNEIWDLYLFDRELKLIVIDAIERI